MRERKIQTLCEVSPLPVEVIDAGGRVPHYRDARRSRPSRGVKARRGGNLLDFRRASVGRASSSVRAAEGRSVGVGRHHACFGDRDSGQRLQHRTTIKSHKAVFTPVYYSSLAHGVEKVFHTHKQLPRAMHSVCLTCCRQHFASNLLRVEPPRWLRELEIETSLFLAGNASKTFASGLAGWLS